MRGAESINFEVLALFLIQGGECEMSAQTTNAALTVPIRGLFREMTAPPGLSFRKTGMK